MLHTHRGREGRAVVAEATTMTLLIDRLRLSAALESNLRVGQPLVPAPICPDLQPSHFDRDDRQLHAARLEQLEQPEAPFAADELAA